MQIQNWNNFLFPYEQAVNELALKFESISDEYKKLGQYSPIESVNARVKKVSSILEKASRKNIALDDLSDHMEDIAGIRIVCKFVEDIPKVIMLIRQRHGSDLKVLEERDYVQNKKESGYRSYHIIIEYYLNTIDGLKTVKAEIQIRTLAMNFWATAEHSLNYKYSGNIPENLKSRLIACAEAADLLDKEMSTIRNEIMYAEKINQIKNDIVNDILDNIKKLHYVAKLDEMNSLNKEFIDLWEEGDLKKLKKFDEQLNIMTELYRI